MFAEYSLSRGAYANAETDLTGCRFAMYAGAAGAGISGD
jgi:hypothetical protein